MSDPLTRAEIEDVLSSIRRLVSAGGRLSEGPRPPGAAAGRLVLTPAQRVGAPPPPADPAATIREAARRLAEVQAAGRPETAAAPLPVPSLEETIAELEAAVAAVGGEWDPDGTETAALAAPAPPPAGAPAPRGAAAEDAADGAAARSRPVAGNVHSLALPRRAPPEPGPRPRLPEGLDESALRDLVAEIVRQELQGALGERITRNVRKLVRAEVARALASRQFD